VRVLIDGTHTDINTTFCKSTPRQAAKPLRVQDRNEEAFPGLQYSSHTHAWTQRQRNPTDRSAYRSTELIATTGLGDRSPSPGARSPACFGVTTSHLTRSVRLVARLPPSTSQDSHRNPVSLGVRRSKSTRKTIHR
jgi:hypothetical protein